MAEKILNISTKIFEFIKRLILAFFSITKKTVAQSFKTVPSSILVTIVITGLFCQAIYVFANPSDLVPSPYYPGETLNPTCSPGDSNCSVTAPAIYSFSTNNFLGTGNFTTTGIVTAGTLKIGSIMTFPTADGSPNQYLKTNGSGALSWSTIDLSGYVPYTGASGNVTLGAYTLTTPTVIGGTGTTSDLNLQTTSGVGTTGADMHFLVGNNGATEAMTILNSGNVGIGTTSPNAKLHVQGTLLSSFAGGTWGTASIMGTHSVSDFPTALDFGAIGQSYPLARIGIKADNNYGSYLMFGTSNSFSTGITNTAMTIDPSGNVGIGTTSPGAKLDVAGTIRSTSGNFEVVWPSAFVIRDTNLTTLLGSLSFDSPGYTKLYSGGGASYGIILDSSGYPYSRIIFKTGPSGNEAMRIDYNGRVGINNNSPGNLLSITTPTTADVLADVMIGTSATTQKGLVIQGKASQTANLFETQLSTGAIKASINSAGDFTNSAGTGDGEKFGADATLGGIRSLAFGNSAFGDTASVAIGGHATASGYSSIAIGYGTTTTTGNTTSSIAIGYQATAGAGQFVAGVSEYPITNVFFGNGVTSATPIATTYNATGGSGTNIAGAALQIAGGKATGNAVGGPIYFQTSDAGASGTDLQSLTTKMTILASGNVGIGTTSPGASLDINSAAVTGAENILNLRVSDNATNYFRLTNSSSTGGVFIPQWTAHSESGSQYTAVAYVSEILAGSDSGTVPVTRFLSQRTNGALTTRPMVGFADYNGNDLVVIGATGNVGIGTTSPATKLDTYLSSTGVLANIQQSVSSNGLALSSGTYGNGNYLPGMVWYTTDASTKPKAGIWAFTSSSGSYLQFGTSNNYATGITNTAMVVDYSGNVGIGTTSPGNKLTITGPTTADALADVMIGTSATTQKGLVIQGKASQTANLQEWQDSSGTAKITIDNNESFTMVADNSRGYTFNGGGRYVWLYFWRLRY